MPKLKQDLPKQNNRYIVLTFVGTIFLELYFPRCYNYHKEGDVMAKHGFGIMEIPPEKGRRYDEYEPQKYNCISVNDDYLEDIIAEFDHIDFYWHTTDIKSKGICYVGITLIPPEALAAFSDVIKEKNGLTELYELTMTAKRENKWIIHFGI